MVGQDLAQLALLTLVISCCCLISLLLACCCQQHSTLSKPSHTYCTACMYGANG
jgi:hypothetical protein